MRKFCIGKRIACAFGAGTLFAAAIPSAANATAISYSIGSAWLDTASFGGAWEWGQIYAPGLSPNGESAGIGRIALSGHDVAAPATPVTLLTYCIDLLDWLGGGTFTEQALGDMAPTTYSYAKLTKLSAFLTHVDPSVGSLVTSVDTSAAAQLGVWEILNETSSSYDVTTGAFRVGVGSGNISNAAIAQANSWLQTDLPGWTRASGQHLVMLNPNNGITALGGGRNQPQVYSAAGAVPEPASWMTMILGFGAVGWAVRRRRAAGGAVA